jgi:hypothetical protein
VQTQFRVIERVLVAVIVLIAASAMLMTFEQVRQFGISLLASAGVAGGCWASRLRRARARRRPGS